MFDGRRANIYVYSTNITDKCNKVFPNLIAETLRWEVQTVPLNLRYLQKSNTVHVTNRKQNKHISCTKVA